MKRPLEMVIQWDNEDGIEKPVQKKAVIDLDEVESFCESTETGISIDFKSGKVFWTPSYTYDEFKSILCKNQEIIRPNDNVDIDSLLNSIGGNNG